MNLVFEREDSRIAVMVDDEAIGGPQSHRVPRVEIDQGLAPLDHLRPARKAVAELEDHVLGQRVEVVLAVDVPAQPLHDDLEERIERAEGGVGRFGHGSGSISRWDELKPRPSAARAVSAPRP